MVKKELTKGVMTTRELADWFGITLNSLNSSSEYKNKKYEELKDYCNYIIINTRIIVKEVYEPIYIKNGEKINREIKKMMLKDIKSKVPFTCIQLGDKYYNLLNNKYGGKISTYESRVATIRDLLWGKPSDGCNCHKTLAKYYKGKVPRENNYIILKPEELVLTREKYEEIFGTAEVDAKKLWDEISKYTSEEKNTKDILKNLGVRDNMFQNYMIKLIAKFNCDWIVNATVVEDTFILMNEI